MTLNRLLRAIFTDKDDRVIIFQSPNPPLVVWFVATVSARLGSGQVRQIFEWTAFGSLVVWSLLEIFYGSTYFRRFLGVVVLGVSVWSRISN